MRTPPHLLIEDVPSVSAVALRRLGILRKSEPPENQWGAVPAGRGSLVPAYFRDDGDVLFLAAERGRRDAVLVQWTSCRYGGSRAWLLCPECQTRRVKLHHVEGRWCCRSCGGLTYQSQRQRSPERGLERAHRIRRDVLRQEGPIRTCDPWPARPKGMRLAKYWELCQQIDADEMAFLRYTHEQAERTFAWAARRRAEAERQAAAYDEGEQRSTPGP